MLKNITLITLCSFMFIAGSNAESVNILHAESLAAESLATESLADVALPQCQELIQGCFAKSGKHKVRCFFTTGKHPFCEGSTLGKLALQRWEISPDKGWGNSAENYRASLNAKEIVDFECLDNFDNRLSSRLITENLNETSLETLKQELRECKLAMGQDIVRP